MGFSHIPAYACYLSFCCCASSSRAWLPLLCTLPPGSCNNSEVSPSPPLPKAEPAHCLPSYALCSITGILHWTHSCMSAFVLCWEPKPGKTTPGVVSPVLIIWEGFLRLAGAALGVGAALLHGCTPASWPRCVSPGSQGIFCRVALSWLAPVSCPTAGLYPCPEAQLCIGLCSMNPMLFLSASFSSLSALNSSPAFQYTECNPQFGAICKHSKSAVQPIIRVINEGIELYQFRCQSFRHNTTNWPPAGPHAAITTL